MYALIQILLISLIAGTQAHSIDSSAPKNFEKKESKVEYRKNETPGNLEVYSENHDLHKKQTGDSYEEKMDHKLFDLEDKADKFILTKQRANHEVAKQGDASVEHRSDDLLDVTFDAKRSYINKEHNRLDEVKDNHQYDLEKTHNYEIAIDDSDGLVNKRLDKYHRIHKEGDDSIEIKSRDSQKDTENDSGILSEQSHATSKAIELGGFKMNANSTSSSSEFRSNPSESNDNVSSFSRNFKHNYESNISSDSSNFGSSTGNFGASTSKSGYSVIGDGNHHVSGSGSLFGYQPSQFGIQKNDFTSFGKSESSLAKLYSKLEGSLQGKNRLNLATYQPIFKELESELKTEDFLIAMNRIQSSLKTQKKSDSFDINAIFQLIQVEENKKISNQISTILTQRLGRAYFIQDFALLFSIAKDTKNGDVVDVSRILVPFMNKFNLSHQAAVQKITEIFSEILVQTGCGKGLSLAFPSVGASRTNDIQFIYAAKPEPIIPQFFDLSQISLIGSGGQNQIRQLIDSEFGFLVKKPKVEATKKVVDTFAGLLMEYQSYQKQIKEIEALLKSKKLPEIKLVLQEPKYATICQNFGLDFQSSSAQALMNQLINAQQSVFSLAETSLQEYKSRSSQFGFNTGSVLDKEFLNFSQSFKASFSSSSSFSSSFSLN